MTLRVSRLRMQANLDLTTPAGANLEASADATWCNRSVYGMILITYARGAIFHHTKKIGMILHPRLIYRGRVRRHRQGWRANQLCV